MEQLFSVVTTLFFVANPIGNSPAILALVKDYSFQQQRWILLRESLFALILVLFFQFVGKAFLSVMGIEGYALGLCGGLLLFFVGLQMVFPSPELVKQNEVRDEPYFVPIATPLLSGPGLMSIVMTLSGQHNSWIMVQAILLTWVGVTAVMAVAPYLLRLLGKRGLLALEQLMGLVLVMISLNMIIEGFRQFILTFRN